MHLGLAQHLALHERFGGQVKLHPLQVEAQTGANGFDETLFQGLGGKGEQPIYYCRQKNGLVIFDKAGGHPLCASCVCVFWLCKTKT